MSLKIEREKKGLTQEKLAQMAEVTTSTIVKAEKKNSCSLENAYKISKIIGKTIEEIFFEEK